MRGRAWAILILAALSGGAPEAGGEASRAAISTIAFGSCAREDKPQPIWEAIARTEPDLFLLLGDNIYADTEDMERMRAKYARLAAQPGYQLLKRKSRVLATWDDHDYGANDAGREYPRKRESRQVFLDFFEEPADSPRRAREGIYDAILEGPEGRRVQVILLDTRWSRSPLRKGRSPEPGSGRPGWYAPSDDPEATILGDPQWRWLETQMRLPAELRVIVSSIQVLAQEHGFETWGNFPAERARLLRLIADSTGATIIVSGDRHHAELSRDDSRGFPILDVTSSALNQSRAWVNERNALRVGNVFFEANFGLLEVSWEDAEPGLSVEIRDREGKVRIRERLTLRELAARP